MKKTDRLSKLSIYSIILCSLCFVACENDDESNEDSVMVETAAGEAAAGEAAAGVATAGEAAAGETAAGETAAGETAGGEIAAGESVAGEDSAATESTGADQMTDEPFVCSQDILQIQSGRVIPTPNLTYLGIDDRFNFSNILQIEFLVDPVADQVYSLEGQTPDNYQIGVFIGAQCTEDGCTDVYFASAGELKFVEFGASGQEIVFEVSGLLLSKINRDNGSLDTSAQSCLSDQEIRVFRPTEVGDVIPDTFALQNCETGEIVNIKEFGAEAKGIWLFATAGWCPACRQRLTYLFAEVFSLFTPETIRPMIVVSEDDQEEPATLAFCRTYATRYADTAADFYVDASLETTFASMWAYFGDDGSFGLPWEAIIEGGTGVYLYADGAPSTETAGDVINRLMEE